MRATWGTSSYKSPHHGRQHHHHSTSCSRSTSTTGTTKQCDSATVVPDAPDTGPTSDLDDDDDAARVKQLGAKSSHPSDEDGGQLWGTSYMKALIEIYFIGGRRHSGCRAMSPGPPTRHSYPPVHAQTSTQRSTTKIMRINSIRKNKILLHSNWRIFGTKFALESSREN